jgi:hypothetical protein
MKDFGTDYEFTKIDYPNGFRNCLAITVKEYKSQGGKLYRCNLTSMMIDEVTPRHTIDTRNTSTPRSLVMIPKIKNLVFIVAGNMDEAEDKFNHVLERQSQLMDELREKRLGNSPKKG